MLAVIEKSFPQVLEDQGRQWHLLDLCSGKSLTSVILAARAPQLCITALDRLSLQKMPHFAAAGLQMRYFREDFLSDDAFSKLKDRIQRLKRPTIATGLHLCGNLRALSTDAPRDDWCAATSKSRHVATLCSKAHQGNKHHASHMQTTSPSRQVTHIHMKVPSGAAPGSIACTYFQWTTEIPT